MYEISNEDMKRMKNGLELLVSLTQGRIRLGKKDSETVRMARVSLSRIKRKDSKKKLIAK